MKTSPNTVQQCRSPFAISSILLSTVLSLGAILSSSTVSADSVVDKINITVPISCTLEGTGQNSHNATINNGQYNSAIGETTMKAFCNDNEGFAIYAIGYTDNANGKNVLTNSTLGSTHDIVTGTSISGSTSNWAMKLNTNSDPIPTYPITIENSFDSFHAVPDTYTLVAKRTSGTDIGESAEGSIIQSTYQAYISPTQAAGTYTGQVKYTLIHPHDEPTPPDSMLDIGANVGIKIKNLSEGITNATRGMQTTKIKAIKTAAELPSDFEPTEANTVSTPDSKYPIYIFFDNTDDTGVMYFYTDGDTIVMNPDSSQIFRNHTNLTDISGLLNWDASKVTSLAVAFYDDRSLASLHGLENWDTGNLESLAFTFSATTKLADISALANWDTSSVTTLYRTFSIGASSALTSLHGLENWNVSKVTDMFVTFGGIPTLTDITALANWDTSSVTSMQSIFQDDSALTSLHGLENWNTGNVTTLQAAFYRMSSLVDASAVYNWDTSSVTNMWSLFSYDQALTSIDLSNWDTGNVIRMNGMFDYDYSLTSINVSNWDTSNVTTMAAMFRVGESHVANGRLVEIIGLGDLDVSNVTDMGHMFYGAGQMTHYDIANWDVSKVESFNHMFCDNFKLESLDLSRWNVSSLKTIANMFDDNYKLTTIGDVSHWNTHKLIDASGWLNGATSFIGDNGTLDLSGWNTANLKAAEEMFRAVKLRTIDLSSWTFDSITNDGWAGAGSGIYDSYGTGLGTMFRDTAQLNTVYVSQSGLDSFNTAVNNGVNTTNMWSGSGASGFTVKP